MDRLEVDKEGCGFHLTAVKRWRTYFLLVACVSFGAVFAGGLLNLVVNPLNVTPSPLASTKLEPYREIAGRMRTGKAGMLRIRNDWRVLLAGSSRVNHALDPRHPVWGGRAVANLGLSGGFLHESEAIIRYALRQGIHPDCVVIGVDPTDLASDYDSRGSSDFAVSPLAPENDPLNRELRYLFGVSMTEQSLKVLSKAASGKPARYSPEGFRLVASGRDGGDQLAFLKEELAAHSVHSTFTRVRSAKEKVLETLAADLRRMGSRVILVYLPIHSLVYADVRDVGSMVIPFEQERRSLCGIAARTGAELWDFNTYHPTNGEALPTAEGGRMKDWDDLGHFTPAVGNLILSTIMAEGPQPAPGYGAVVTPAGLEAHLRTVRLSYQLYLTGDGRTDLGLKGGGGGK